MSIRSDITRCYTELSRFDTLEDRFEYLKLDGEVGEELFGYARYLNQIFYHGERWRDAKNAVVLRDKGYDLGLKGWKISGHIYVHHMNPVTLEQLKNDDPCLYDPEFLISCSFRTHQAITWGNKALLPQAFVIRRPNDTCPWKKEDTV